MFCDCWYRNAIFLLSPKQIVLFFLKLLDSIVATGVQPLTCLKSEPILSDNVVLNLNERRSPTPSARLSPCIKSEDSTGTGKGTPWGMSGSSTPQRSPKELLSPVLPSTTTSLCEHVYHQPHKLPTPPHSPPCEQSAQSSSSSSHEAGAGMRLRVTAAADWMQSNQGLELPPIPSHFSSSSHSLSQSPFHSTNYSFPQVSPPYLSPLQSPSHSPVARPPRRWRKGQQLGKGSFGTVYEGWNLCVLLPPIFMSLFHNPFSGATESTHRQPFFHLTLLFWDLSGCSDFGLVCMCKTGMMVAFLL